MHESPMFKFTCKFKYTSNKAFATTCKSHIFRCKFKFMRVDVHGSFNANVNEHSLLDAQLHVHLHFCDASSMLLNMRKFNWIGFVQLSCSVRADWIIDHFLAHFMRLVCVFVF